MHHARWICVSGNASKLCHASLGLLCPVGGSRAKNETSQYKLIRVNTSQYSWGGKVAILEREVVAELHVLPDVWNVPQLLPSNSGPWTRLERVALKVLRHRERDHLRHRAEVSQLTWRAARNLTPTAEVSHAKNRSLTRYAKDEIFDK